MVLLAFLCLRHSAVGQGTQESHESNQSQSSAQLARTAESYEDFIRVSTGTPERRSEVRQRLGAVYYLLHRYGDSLQVLTAALNSADQSNPNDSRTASGSLVAQSWLVMGLDYTELNQLPDAAKSLRRSLAMQPDSANARLALGDVLARSGRMADAEAEYEEQTRRTPALADAWYKLGLVHSQLSVEISRERAKSGEGALIQELEAEELLAKGDNLNAARSLFRLVRSLPNRPEVQSDLGIALLRLGYLKAAEDHFNQELAGNPNSPSAALGLVQTAAMSGQWEEVARRLEELSRSQPKELLRLMEFPPVGILQQASSKGDLKPPQWFAPSPAGRLWESWFRDAEVVAQISPNSGSAPGCAAAPGKGMQLGVWMTEACYSRLAAQLRAKAQLSPNEKAKLIEAEFRLGQYPAALNAATQLHTVDPKSAWAIYWLSKAHDAMAEGCFLKVGSLNPDSARVHQMLAEHYTKLADYPKAKAEFQRAILLAPQSPDLHLGLGTVLSRAGEFSEAEKELKATIEVSPKSSFAHYQLGHVYVQQSRWTDAIAQLRQVPNDTTVVLSARLDLAKAESETGQTAKAIKDLQSVSALDQDGELYFRLAALYRKNGDDVHTREALATFQQRRAALLQTDNDELSALEKEQDTGQLTALPSTQ
jgi:tetratricopeptide (TPR) repeat protein